MSPKKAKILETSILVENIKECEQWYDGYSEKDKSRMPTILEKQQMIRYPHVSAIIQLSYFPLLAAKVSIKGDETQEKFLKLWFARHYTKMMRIIYSKAMTWGFSVGERLYDTIKMDGKTYWIHKGVIVPQPYDCRLLFRTKPTAAIKGFEYRDSTIERFGKKGETKVPGMVYYSFRGDELSLPYGDSMLNDMFWIWQLLMKTWTNMVMYQHRHVPVWILEYLSEYAASDTDHKTDLAVAKAKQLLKDAKNLGGIHLPKHIADDGKIEKGWEFNEATATDREISYMSTINTENTMLYISALLPERLTEQFKDTGSEAMVKVQRGFYESNIVETRLKETTENLRTWFIDPMLTVNFGKIDCEVNLTIGDKSIEFLGQVMLEGMRQGMVDAQDIDLREIAQKVGLPVNPLTPEPTIEKEERTQVPGMQFQRRRTRKQQSKTIKEIAKDWVEPVNNKLNVLKERCYEKISIGLRQLQGSIGLKVINMPDDIIKANKLAELVQIPRKAFDPIDEYLMDAFYITFEKFLKKSKMSVPDKPGPEVTNELNLLGIDFKGVGGKKIIGGQPEAVEKVLFRVIMRAVQNERLNQFNEAFNNYIEVTLPDKILFILNEAAQKGFLYGVKEGQRQELEKKKKEGI